MPHLRLNPFAAFKIMELIKVLVMAMGDLPIYVFFMIRLLKEDDTVKTNMYNQENNLKTTATSWTGNWEERRGKPIKFSIYFLMSSFISTLPRAPSLVKMSLTPWSPCLASTTRRHSWMVSHSSLARPALSSSIMTISPKKITTSLPLREE